MRASTTMLIGILLMAVPMGGMAAETNAPLTAPAMQAQTTLDTPVPTEDGYFLYTVGFFGDPPLEVGDTFRGAEVVSVNDAIDMVQVRTLNGATFENEARNDDRVRYVNTDSPVAMVPHYTPNDPRVGEQWGWDPAPGIDAYAAWDTTLGDTGTVVAVIDSGLDKGHEDIGNYLQGFDFYNDDNDPDDTCDHGTHVAGTVGAITDNGIGVAGTAQTTIMPLKALEWQGIFFGCSGSFADVADAITYAADNGADVISMSLGCDGCSDQSVTDAIQYAWDNGALIVASAGNAGPCSNCVGFPATDANVIAVSALDSDGSFASYSSQGPEVELAAPGTDILSTTPGDSYSSFDGTSMAAPHVSGTAALVLAVDGTLSNAQLRDNLNTNAVDVGLSGNEQGNGAVNADNSVDAAGGGGGTNSPPTASFTHDCTDLDCTFDGSGSSDSDGSITAYDWDFGDGNTGSGVTVSHTYASDGTYTVTLTVTDDDGATDTDSQDVTVSSGGGGGDSVHTHDIDHYMQGPHVKIDVWAYDNNENPEPGVTVSVEVCRQSDGQCATGSGDTGSDGKVTFRWKQAGPGTYETCVTDMTKAGFTWDSAAGHAGSGNCETETV